MAAQGKYNDRTIKLIVDAIERTGQDSDGYKNAAISHQTFYKWMNEKSDFSELIANAKDYYRRHSIPQYRKWASEWATKTLESASNGGELITTTTQEVFSPEGEIVTLTKVERKPMPVPLGPLFAWAMGEADVTQWLNHGVKLGLFPSEFVGEMANELNIVVEKLRSKIGNYTETISAESTTEIDREAFEEALGIDTTPLSTEVDQRQINT